MTFLWFGFISLYVLIGFVFAVVSFCFLVRNEREKYFSSLSCGEIFYCFVTASTLLPAWPLAVLLIFIEDFSVPLPSGPIQKQLWWWPKDWRFLSKEIPQEDQIGLFRKRREVVIPKGFRFLCPFTDCQNPILQCTSSIFSGDTLPWAFKRNKIVFVGKYSRAKFDPYGRIMCSKCRMAIRICDISRVTSWKPTDPVHGLLCEYLDRHDQDSRL